MFDRLFQSSLDGVLLTRPDGQVLRANPAACRALRRTEAEICAAGRRGLLVETPELRALLQQRSTGSGVSGEFCLLRPDGTTFPAEFTSGLFHAGDEAVAYVIFRDVSEKRRAEQAERAQLDTLSILEAMTDVMVDPVFVKDLESRWLFANTKLLEIIGKSMADVIGKTDLEIHADPAIARALMEVDRRVMSSGQSEVIEEHVVTRLGPRTFLATKTPFRDASGRTVGLIGTAHDITERRAAEAHRERLATALEQAAETVVITDTTGAIVYANPAFEQVTGYTRTEVLGQNPRLLKSDRQSPAFYEQLWRTLGAGQTWRGRLVNRAKDGHLFTEDASISPVRDASGATTAYVAVKRDISRDLELEAQLLQSQKMEGIGRLAGGIAHDFNNVLTVIMSISEAGVETLRDGDPLRADLQEIDKAAQRAASLTRQLLAFSRKQRLEPVPLDLSQLVDDLEKMLRRLLGEDLTLVKQLSRQLGVVMADPGQLEQVVMNLVINARDAMKAGGTLTIETRDLVVTAADAARRPGLKPGPQVMLSVTDTGHGMDEATKARIFEPFFTTKPVGHGTGLGLSTVYGIVKQSGGFIDCQTAPGKGTRFEVLLPREASQGATSRATPPPTALRGTERVLLVEDDDAVRALMHRVLTGAGYTVLAASNGGEALLLFEQGADAIDLVVTDVVMPLMNGYALVERLAQVRPGVRALYMSGYTDANTTSREHLAFVQKPVTPHELLKRVRQVLTVTR